MQKKAAFVSILLMLAVTAAIAQEFVPPVKEIDSLEVLKKVTGKAKIEDGRLKLEFYNGTGLNLKSITFEAYVKNLRGHIIKQKEYKAAAEGDKAQVFYVPEGAGQTGFPAFKKLSNCTVEVITDLRLGVGKRLDWKMVKVEAYTGEMEK